MKPVLLIDFGSTYTKVTAVDIDGERLLGTASAYTTADADIINGLANALSVLENKTGKIEYAEKYACSSAAGGLRMAVCGLVPELTAEAARLASLGAGAKIIKIYSYQLTEDDIEEIRKAKPDIFLLAGGTDGGNTECIVHNAKALRSLPERFPVIIAGNRTAAAKCGKILNGWQVFICENVMPKFGVLNIEPAQNQIREIFLHRIIEAKGITKASKLISGIVMPTPSAVLKAVQLLAEGCGGEKGIGSLITVDVGGATTDVYSVADGAPGRINTVYKGLPEPYVKRTVEGDIGMRYSIHGIEDCFGIKRISQLSGLSENRTRELVKLLGEKTDMLPNGVPELEALDFALASLATEAAVTRHAGTVKETYSMSGLVYVQSGKDLTEVRQIVLTGGSLIHTKRTNEIAVHALYSPEQPASLRPKDASVWVDRSYILAAMGLLSEHYPKTALKIMKKEIKMDGFAK
ncbi:MAG: methylaspartate mutase accessory protein GlmL [Bacillota bacterium]|nr:methylaspartate mutase accessory protein GlmL [Bacillota bacterium]